MSRSRIGCLAAALAVVLVSCGEPRAEAPCPAAPGEICTLAGTGDLGWNRDGHSPRKTDLYLVSAARRGPDGLVYLMDFNNQRLRVITEGGQVQTAIGNGEHALAAIENDALDTPLENPIDFDFLPDRRLVFVSYHDPRVIAVEPDGSLVALAGSGEVGVLGDEGDGGPALDAQFIQLDGIAIAADETIYISDSLAHRVRRIADGVVTTVAGTGMTTGESSDGPGVLASLFWPTALALDLEGNLLIADTRHHRVRKLSADGLLTSVAGTGVAGGAGDGGPALEAELDQPNGLAVGEDGSIWIADRANFRVRKIDPDGRIETVAGTGEKGATGDGGAALQATFGYLARIALDGRSLLVADQSNSRVRYITAW